MARAGLVVKERGAEYFPFIIFHFSSAAAGFVSRTKMHNDKWKMITVTKRTLIYSESYTSLWKPGMASHPETIERLGSYALPRKQLDVNLVSGWIEI